MDYSSKNAKPVLEKVNKYIASLEDKKKIGYRHPKIKIKDCCNELSIFDWWKDDLTLSDLKKMKSFLNKSIKMGYTGYVCFKVGVNGCANGMWSHKLESVDGYSPNNSDFIWHNFNSEKSEWCAFDKDGNEINI